MRIASILAAALFALAGCGDDDDDSVDAMPRPDAPGATADAPPDTPDAPPAGGTMLITEVADHAVNGNVKYVEIYNATADPVLLDGWALRRYANGNTTAQDVDLSGVTVQPADTLVVARTVADFNDVFGVNPDLNSNAVITGDGNDVYELFDGAATVDVYGEIGTDGTGTAWEYTDSIAKRNAGIVDGNATWTAAEWTITAGVDDANPGSRD